VLQTAPTAGPSSSPRSNEDLAQRDRAEADSLFEILERQIVPLFYDREAGPGTPGVGGAHQRFPALAGHQCRPRAWFSDYVETLYEPTARRADVLTKQNYARAKELAAWKSRVSSAWSSVQVIDVDSGPATRPSLTWATAGRCWSLWNSGSLSSDDVAVELLHGPVVAGDELASTEVVARSLCAVPAEQQ